MGALSPWFALAASLYTHSHVSRHRLAGRGTRARAVCERACRQHTGGGGSSQKRAGVKSQASSRHLQRNNSGRPLCTVASHRRQKQQAGHAGPPCTLLSCFASRGRVQAGGPVPRPDVQLTRRAKLTRSATAPCSACHAVNSRSRWAMCRRWPVSQESSASAPVSCPSSSKSASRAAAADGRKRARSALTSMYVGTLNETGCTMQRSSSGRPCRLRLCWLCCCHTLERLPVGLEPALLLALATLPVARIGKILELLLAWRVVSTWLAQDPPRLLQLRIATSLASSTSRTLRLQ